MGKQWFHGLTADDMSARLKTPERRAERSKVREAIGVLLCIAFVAAIVGLYSYSLSARAEEPAKALFVVATQQLDRSPYERAVMLVAPFNGGHVGVVLNKPAAQKMSDLFPEHAASANVRGPLYHGGPVLQETVFMLAKFKARPAERALEMLPGIWLVFDGRVIDQVIETRPNDARYFIGSVGWNEGGLFDRVKSGMFVLKPASAERALGDPAYLYEQLMPAGPKAEFLRGKGAGT